jgi:hypothetical protein
MNPVLPGFKPSVLLISSPRFPEASFLLNLIALKLLLSTAHSEEKFANHVMPNSGELKRLRLPLLESLSRTGFEIGATS